jgi:hypothetical protein
MSLFVTVFLLACSSNVETTPVTSTTTTGSSTTTSSSTTSTGTTGTTGTKTTGTTSTLPVVDCAKVNNDLVEVTVLDGPRAGRGLTFNTDGDLLIGIWEPHIAQSPYAGPIELVHPNYGGMEQIDRLHDGDYVFADHEQSTLVRMTQDGKLSLIATGMPTYLVRVGPDGMVYTTNGEVGLNNVIQRTDPDTGVTEEVLKGRDGTPPFEARVMDFSPDLSRMYIGTHTDSAIYVVDLDEDLNPINDPVILAASVGSWHDGLGVDACGYLWVASYDDQSTYRVSPDGSDVRRMLNSSFQNGMYGHGVFWGTGKGGFREDALYIPQPNNNDTVGEAIIGVPYRTWQGKVVNAP